MTLVWGRKCLFQFGWCVFFHQMVILRSSGKDIGYVQILQYDLNFGMTFCFGKKPSELFLKAFFIVKCLNICHIFQSGLDLIQGADWLSANKAHWRICERRDLSSNLLTFSACWKVFLTLPLSYMPRPVVFEEHHTTLSVQRRINQIKELISSQHLTILWLRVALLSLAYKKLRTTIIFSGRLDDDGSIE